MPGLVSAPPPLFVALASAGIAPLFIAPTSVITAKWFRKLSWRQQDSVIAYLFVVFQCCIRTHTQEIRDAADSDVKRERMLKRMKTLLAAKIPCKLLERFLDRNKQGRILELLLAHRVVIVDAEPQKYVTSRVLRFSPAILKNGFTFIQPSTKLYRRKLATIELDQMIESPNDNECAAFAALKRIEIDLQAAVDSLNEADFAFVQQLRLADDLLAFANGTPRLTRGKNSGRLFSHVTNLKRELRSSLRVDSEQLVEIDLIAAQALFLANLADDVRSDHYVREFAELTQSGNLYRTIAGVEAIAKKLSQYMPDSEPEKAAKKSFFSWLFFNPRAIRKPPVAMAIDGWMKATYPTVWQVVADLKKHNHKHAARRLQRMESDLVIGRVLPALLNRTFAATIHDSVLVKESDAAFARDVLLRAFDGYMFKPLL